MAASVSCSRLSRALTIGTILHRLRGGIQANSACTQLPRLSGGPWIVYPPDVDSTNPSPRIQVDVPFGPLPPMEDRLDRQRHAVTSYFLTVRPRATLVIWGDLINRTNSDTPGGTERLEAEHAVGRHKIHALKKVVATGHVSQTWGARPELDIDLNPGDPSH